jgi:hypothetical protein
MELDPEELRRQIEIGETLKRAANRSRRTSVVSWSTSAKAWLLVLLAAPAWAYGPDTRITCPANAVAIAVGQDIATIVESRPPGASSQVGDLLLRLCDLLRLFGDMAIAFGQFTAKRLNFALQPLRSVLARARFGLDAPHSTPIGSICTAR